MTNRDEQMIAHHEAGHVVAMWKLGYGVERVSIEPEDGLEGFADSSYEYVDLYLTRAADRLRTDPRIPNVVILSLTYRCSPWHRSWCEKSATSSPAPRASIVPASIVELSARRDRRPVLAALGPLSRRAARSLDRAGIRTVADLEDTSARALAAVKGCGRKTVEEIMLAVRRARIQMSA